MTFDQIEVVVEKTVFIHTVSHAKAKRINSGVLTT